MQYLKFAAAAKSPAGGVRFRFDGLLSPMVT
jgi:hypothetical protein